MSIAAPVLFIVLGLIVAYLIVTVHSLRSDLKSTRTKLDASREKTNLAKQHADGAKQEAAALGRRFEAMRDQIGNDEARLDRIVSDSNGAISGLAERVNTLTKNFASHRDAKSIHFPTDGIETMVGRVEERVGTFAAALEEEQKARIKMDESLRERHNEHSHDDDKPTVHGLMQLGERIEQVKSDLDQYVPYGVEVRTRKNNGRFGPSYSFEHPKGDEESDSA